MLLQPFCLLPELHRGIIQLSEKCHGNFWLSFLLKEHFLLKLSTAMNV